MGLCFCIEPALFGRADGQTFPAYDGAVVVDCAAIFLEHGAGDVYLSVPAEEVIAADAFADGEIALCHLLLDVQGGFFA